LPASHPPASEVVGGRGEVVEKLQGGEARPQVSVAWSAVVGGLLTTCAAAPGALPTAAGPQRSAPVKLQLAVPSSTQQEG
jgi:hypothetical protein